MRSLRLLEVLALVGILTSAPTAFAANCQSVSGLQAGRVLDIIPEDQISSPWTNETPRKLRSTDSVDGRRALRADLSNWAPIAFDAHQQVSAGDYDFLELRLRSSLANPPLRVITNAGALCPLGSFTTLQSNTWTLVQIPLSSLGYDSEMKIGRIKLKSATAEPFTVWITDARLALASGSTDPEPPEPEVPNQPDDEEPPPQPETPGQVRWDLDPGVKGTIADHIPSRSVSVQADGNDLLDDSAAFLSAIEAVSGGGIVNIPAGTYYLSVPLSLTQNNQILRGAGSDQTRIVMTQSQPVGISITGQYPQDRTQIIEARYQSDEMFVGNTTAFTPGRYAVITDTGSSHSQVVKIIEQNQRNGYTRLKLDEPLNSSFSSTASMQVFNANEYSGIEDLTIDVLNDQVHVNDMLYFRSAAHAWVRNVTSKRARQAHVFTRQTYHCEISSSTFDNATGHGDGKQGYGVDLANSTTGCLVENNLLQFLRHSIILNQGANGNIVAFNHSRKPRHTNFATGGPGDISFHHFSYANLVEGNVIERIHIGDAGSVGTGNLIHRNCLTSGPLTIENSAPGAKQYLIGNAMYGSDSQLHQTIMPPVYPEKPLPRTYLNYGNTLFNDNGMVIAPNVETPFQLNNWYAGRRHNENATNRTTYYGAVYAPIPSTTISGNWQIDCQIPALQ